MRPAFACCFGSCRAAAVRTRPTTIAIAGHIMDIDGYIPGMIPGSPTRHIFGYLPYCPFAHKWGVVFGDPLSPNLRTEGNFQVRFSRRKLIEFPKLYRLTSKILEVVSRPEFAQDHESGLRYGWGPVVLCNFSKLRFSKYDFLNLYGRFCPYSPPSLGRSCSSKTLQ